MDAGHLGRRVFVAGAAVAGVVGAHVVDYLAIYPGGAARGHHLAATGHGYWPAAVILGAVAAAAVTTIALSRGAGVLTGSMVSRPRLVELAVCQVLLFSLVEVAERNAAGVNPAVLLNSPEFTVGVLFQVLMAFAVVRLLAALERAGEVLASLVRRRRRSPPMSTRWARVDEFCCAGRRRVRVVSRGPPPLLV